MNRDPQVRPRAILADRVFDGADFHDRAAVLIDGRHIRGLAAWREVPSEAEQVRLPAGALLAPGFIDLQVNGGGGVLLNDEPTAEGMRAIARAHRKFGTTGCLPTLITDMRARMKAVIAAAPSGLGAGVLGLHLEGPFLNPARKGVHRPDLIRTPDDADLELLRGLASVGRSMVTLAPERVPEGFVRALAESGVRVAAGHSEASADEMARAVDEGLTGVTHLFNAMPPLAGRAPGIVGATLSEPRLIAGIIADGVHVDPVSIRAAFAAKGAAGLALVTDAMPTVGSKLDHFELMGRRVSLSEGRLTIEDGTLGGAHLDMASAVRNAVQIGLPLGDALQSAALTPARFLGIADERGALTAGAFADLVALTAELDVIATWIEGEAS
jgi:N-acetylglucosamine-6-phosphate deacetylase